MTYERFVQNFESIEGVIASFKRGQKGEQRMQRRNKFSFTTEKAHMHMQV